MNDTLSFIPLGGIEDVTRNMYLYEYKDEILVVDCGIGFADETMIGVDLLIPDVTYLVQSCLPAGKAKKKIVGMVFTHGHEDHIGALPFILPQLQANTIPLFASPFTAALANEKLKEYGVGQRVTPVPFDGRSIQLGSFGVSFIRITHSVPDTSNILIKTPVGTIYHGSDFKFDPTPFDGKETEFGKIEAAGKSGILCLMSDCLGAERKGQTRSEITLSENFEREIGATKGKCIVTTYSSNVARFNQIAAIAKRYNRHICFVGRSLLKVKDVAQKMDYMRLPKGMEISVDEIRNYADNQLLLFVAGSQGQEESAMSRIANNEHKEIKLTSEDTVIFSADPIPGSEVLVYSLIDTIAKTGARVVYSDLSNGFHVSGHGTADDLLKMISLTQPKKLVPIGGTYRHMVAYKRLAQEVGYKAQDILLLEDGQEIIFSKDTTVAPGRKIPLKTVYLDEITREELEHFVLRDRQKLSEGGIVVVLAEVEATTGRLVNPPDIIARGFALDKNFNKKIYTDLKQILERRKGRVTNWIHVRKVIEETTSRRLFKSLRREPLVLPVVLEV